jgi:hypothetical protein
MYANALAGANRSLALPGSAVAAVDAGGSCGKKTQGAGLDAGGIRCTPLV